MKSYKGLGLVNEVFKESKLEELSGNIGIGHVRYSTTGSTTAVSYTHLIILIFADDVKKIVICIKYGAEI